MYNGEWGRRGEMNAQLQYFLFYTSIISNDGLSSAVYIGNLIENRRNGRMLLRWSYKILVQKTGAG
jgi:hypothetical protein